MWDRTVEPVGPAHFDGFIATRAARCAVTTTAPESGAQRIEVTRKHVKPESMLLY
jgi:uncharacterized protein YcbX